MRLTVDRVAMIAYLFRGVTGSSVFDTNNIGWEVTPPQGPKADQYHLNRCLARGTVPVNLYLAFAFQPTQPSSIWAQ